MKKILWGIVAIVAMIALAGCPNNNNGNGGNGTPPPEPEVLEFLDVVPGEYWRPFYVRAYAEGGLERSVEPNEPTFADLIEAYCQYWSETEQGEGDVTAYLDMDGNGIIYPWEAVYDFGYLFDGTYLWINDWGIPFTVKDVSADGWTMRLDGDDVGFADFLDDLGLVGYAWIEIDFEPCGLEPGDVVDDCLDADEFIPDPDSQDNWEILSGGTVLSTENNKGWIAGAAALDPIDVGGNLGALFTMEYRYDDLRVPDANYTPEYNKFLVDIGAYTFEVRPHTDRVRINPGGQGYAVNIQKGGVILAQAVINPFQYSAVRKWLGVEIMMSSAGVGMRVEVTPGSYVVVMVPGEDASGTYTDVGLRHRTGTDENVNDVQMAFREFCYENIPVYPDCGCED